MLKLSKKLGFLIKALSLSRVGFASAIGVDKSLVGRWVSGKVTPSENNLARITRFAKNRIPDFSLLDWEREHDDFIAFVQRSLNSTAIGANTVFPLLTPNLANQAKQASISQSAAYEGIWRTTRPSSDVPGEFLNDISMVQRDENGFLLFTARLEGFEYNGTAVIVNRKLYYFASNDVVGTITMGIINGVLRNRAMVMDGVAITTLLNSASSPAAMCIHMERIDDLSGCKETDDAKFRELANAQKILAPPGTVPNEIAEALHGAANAPGMLRIINSLTRGPMIEKN